MQHRLSKRFVFLYSGTLALKHDPDLLDSREHFRISEGVIAVATSGVRYDA